MDLLGGDADLGAEAELAAVGEGRGGVGVHLSLIHISLMKRPMTRAHPMSSTRYTSTNRPSVSHSSGADTDMEMPSAVSSDTPSGPVTDGYTTQGWRPTSAVIQPV